MIGVIVPAHNERRLLGRCLASLKVASDNAKSISAPSKILVVLDACTDDSAQIAHDYGVYTLELNVRNVGAARKAGAEWMLEHGATWLSCTDADSCVPRHWLTCQLGFDAEAVCGTVRVSQWQARHTAALRERYSQHYQNVEGHRHIHGANLGICSEAYLKAGGFKPLSAHEDVQLVADLEAIDANIVWTAKNCVSTSSRHKGRATGGFADFISTLTAAVAAE